MRASVVLCVVLVGVLVAGCFNSKDANPPPPSGGTHLQEIPEFPIESDHNHKDPKLHNASANLELVAYHSGYGSGGSSEIPEGEGFSELFVRDGLAFLGRRGGSAVHGGFVIFDVSKPAQPKKLGEYEGLANYDMESTYDNHYVFFVSQFLPNQQSKPVPPDGDGDLPRGIHVVDISDRAHPREASYFPIPTRGAHTITYHRTETGRELLAAQTYDFVPDPSLGLPAPSGPINPASQRLVLFDFLRTPTPHLEPLSVFEKHPTEDEAPPLPSAENPMFPHDSSIQKHPKTGALILYVAYWDLGVYLVDITDPTHPTEISRLTDFSPSIYARVHLAAPADTLIDGRHITVTEPELTHGNEPETGQYTIFDTTDPTHPVKLGYWRLPGNLSNADTKSALRFSPHNFEVENGTLYLAHYHAGVWVVDVHNESLLREPKALAFAQPNMPRPGYGGDIPNVWTALHDHGYIFASDTGTGLYVYHFAGEPVPSPAPTTAPPPSNVVSDTPSAAEAHT